MGGEDVGHPGVAWKELREVQAAAAMSALRRRSFLNAARSSPTCSTHPRLRGSEEATATDDYSL